MRIERLSVQRQAKPVLRCFVEEMTAAGYPPAWARGIAAGVSAGRLPALVAWIGGRPQGVIAWSVREGRGVIQMLYATLEEPRGVLAALVEAALPAMRAAGARRVVHQLRCRQTEAYRRAFRAIGFEELRVEKLILRRPVGVEAPVAPAGYSLRSWQASDCESAVRIFGQLQRAPAESLLWPELDTAAGARALIEMLTRGEGAQAWVAEWAPAGEMVGYALARLMRQGEGRLGELGVAPAHQRRGLGRALAAAALQGLWQAGATEVSLTVSAENAPAQALYRALGFEFRDAQTVFLWSG